MLVLTRKLDEEIRIGQDIVLKVVEIRGGRVRLGIEAPESIQIARSEISNWRGNGKTPIEQSQRTAQHADGR